MLNINVENEGDQMLIIDRIEDGVAVIENGEERLEIPAEALPNGAVAGDVLTKTEDGYTVDRETTDLRRGRMNAAAKKIFKECL